MKKIVVGTHPVRFALRASALLSLLPLLFAQGVAQAPTHANRPQLHIATTGAFITAANDLAPLYLKRRQIDLKLESGGSAGTAPTSIPVWLDRGDLFDLVIVSEASLDDLIKRKIILPGSKVNLVRSDIGLACKSGTPKPDIHNAEALKKALLNAKSIAYTTGVSGVYVRDVVFPKLGIAEQMKAKTLIVQDAGEAVADAKAEFGFQQVSELMPIAGVEVLHLPRDAAEPSIFSAGIPANAPHPQQARDLLHWLNSPAAYKVIRKSGLQPFGANLH